MRYPLTLLVTIEHQCVNDQTGKLEMHKVSLSQGGKLVFHNHSRLSIRRLANLMEVGGGNERCRCARLLLSWRKDQMSDLPQEEMVRERMRGSLSARLQRKLALRRSLRELPELEPILDVLNEPDKNGKKNPYESESSKTHHIAASITASLRQRGYQVRRDGALVYMLQSKVVLKDGKQVEEKDKTDLVRIGWHGGGKISGWAELRDGSNYGGVVMRFSNASRWSIRFAADYAERKIVTKLIETAIKRNKQRTITMVEDRGDRLEEQAFEKKKYLRIDSHGDVERGAYSHHDPSTLDIEISVNNLTIHAAALVMAEINKILPRIDRVSEASKIRVSKPHRFPGKPRGSIGQKPKSKA
jgi:hypothetical protein